MPAAYVIVDMSICDSVRYREYMAASPATVAAAGGEFLARGGRHQTLEGDWQPQRMVVLRFPSYAAAQAWYDGAYAAVRPLRAGATDFFNMVLLEGAP